MIESDLLNAAAIGFMKDGFSWFIFDFPSVELINPGIDIGLTAFDLLRETRFLSKLGERQLLL